MEQHRHVAALQQGKQLVVGRISERHLPVQSAEPLKIVHRAAHTALKGFLFLPQALDALTGKVHLSAIGVAHTADALVVRPRDRRIGVRSALPCTAQVQYFPQAQRRQPCVVGLAFQQIKVAAAVEQTVFYLPPIRRAVAAQLTKVICALKFYLITRGKHDLHETSPFVFFVIIPWFQTDGKAAPIARERPCTVFFFIPRRTHS